MLLATVDLSAATSTVSKNLAYFGLKTPPTWLLEKATDRWTLGFGLAVILIWSFFVLNEPKSRRQKIQDGLRPHLGALTEAQNSMIRAETDEDFFTAEVTLDTVIQSCAQWIIDNMGSVAFGKFNTPDYLAGSFTWGGAAHEPAVAKRRSDKLCLNAARIKVIDQMLISDAWDGPPTTRWQLLKRRYRYGR